MPRQGPPSAVSGAVIFRRVRGYSLSLSRFHMIFPFQQINKINNRSKRCLDIVGYIRDQIAFNRSLFICSCTAALIPSPSEFTIPAS